MPELPKGIEGEPLTIGGREVEFSSWPTKANGQSRVLNYRLYISDPWPFLRDYINRKFTETIDEKRKKDADHYLWQAEDYYRTALTASIHGAKPVLLFYCFENLVKSAVLCQGIEDFYRSTKHGLGRKDSNLKAYPSRKDKEDHYRVSVFYEFMKFLNKQALIPAGGFKEYSLSYLEPQLLMGHRMWSAAKETSDRFVRIKEILPMQGKEENKIWLRIKLEKASVQSYEPFCKELLSKTQLLNEWHEIRSDSEEIITLEQCKVEPFATSPIEELQKLARMLRPHLWQAAVISPPYRKYYLYAAPNDEHKELLPQLASIYALMFYLSDLTRYHPSEFYALLQSSLGPFYMGLLQDSPKQFLYLLASEMIQREVSSGEQV